MTKSNDNIFEIGDACFDPLMAVSWQKTKPNEDGRVWSEIYLSSGHTMTIDDDGEAFEFVKKVRKPKPMAAYTSGDIADKLNNIKKSSSINNAIIDDDM